MNRIILLVILNSAALSFAYGQEKIPNDQTRKSISTLIDRYSEAREKKDSSLLKTILTEDVDQLVSTGEWRNGVDASVQGMLKSSSEKPGTRTLTIDKIKMLNAKSGIVDCRYEIQNTDGTSRKMWSTFIVVANKDTWKISAIRNMLPGGL